MWSAGYKCIITDMILGIIIIPNDVNYEIATSQGRCRQSGWSGFGRTTISQSKNKIPLAIQKASNKTKVLG